MKRYKEKIKFTHFLSCHALSKEHDSNPLIDMN